MIPIQFQGFMTISSLFDDEALEGAATQAGMQAKKLFLKRAEEARVRWKKQNV